MMFDTEERGFTLIELIVVLIITAILAQLGFIASNRFSRRSRALSAKIALENIKKECESNSDIKVNEEFTILPPYGYSFSSGESGDCNSNNGLIIAKPFNYDRLPEYSYDFSKRGRVECSQNSSDKFFKDCMTFKDKLESKRFVIKDSYLERGCSAYVVLEGSTWDEAEENSQRLGGNLVSINSKEENEFLTKKIKWDTPKDESKGAYGYAKREYGEGWTAYWIGLRDSGQEGKLEWSDGSPVDYIRKSPSDSRGNEDWQTLISNGEWNDIDQTGSDGGTEHWQMKMGIAEINKCKT